MVTLTAGKTAQQIYDEIIAYINSSPYPASSWYTGITQDVDQRLFGAHNVSRGDRWWAYDRAKTSADARNIEEALLRWGCDGGNGGGDGDTVYVYAYLKTAKTVR